jgi:hypothetical protein
VLERLGWEFVRIRGSAFYRDPDAALRRVFDRLEELGIKPVGPEEREPEAPPVDASPPKSLVEQLEDLLGRPPALPSPPPAIATADGEGEAAPTEPKKVTKPRRRFGR